MKKMITCLAILGIFQLSHGQKKSSPKNIVMFLQENVEILDFAGPMEVFLIAGFNVYTVAKSAEPMKAMHSLTVVPDYSIDNAPDPDIIVFVGGGNLQSVKDPKIQEWIKNTAPGAELQFTVCTGAFFLAESGFLDNKVATTFHKSIHHLSAEYPKIDVRDNVRFVDNGKLITTAGISAGIDGALHLVSKLKGEKYARQVAQDMEYDKWIPEEGLILQNPTLTKMKKEGIDKALGKNSDNDFFLGELLNLSSDLSQKGQHLEAEKCIRYVIDHMQSPDIMVYNYLRETYVRQGKEVPLTSNEFIEIVKVQGVKAAEEVFAENQRKYKDWVFINPDDLITLAYTENNLRGDLKKTLDIQALAKRIFPKNAYVTYVLGVYHEKNDDLKKAIELYKEALILDPTLVYAVDKIKKLKEEGKI